MALATFVPFTQSGRVQRFDGPNGWLYLPFDEGPSAALRGLVGAHWPALLKVAARIGEYRWIATVMPIKDGPLFIAMTAPVRRALGIDEGDEIAVVIAPVAEP